jgi:hypothetical protein
MVNAVKAPVELLVLQFPGQQPDAAAVEAVREIIDAGLITILDLLYVERDQAGVVQVVELDHPERFGLTSAAAQRFELVSDLDAEEIGSQLPDGTCAAVLVYEQSWTRRVSSVLAGSGGQVALHIQVPQEVVESAMAATSSDTQK